MSLEASIKRIIKTGKIEIGSNKTIDNLKKRKAKAVVITENTPKRIKEDILHHAKIAGIPVITFKGTPIRLGEICGKPFIVAAISIINTGDVKLKELTEENKS